MKHILTIAGSDPCGGAGIQVDLQVYRDHGCHGLSCLSAVVWQNTQGVQGWEAMSADVVTAQVLTILEDVPVHCIKLGMLATAENVLAVSKILATHPKIQHIPVVCDPVLASGDGLVSLAKDALVDAMKHSLFAHVDVLTPNISEAQVLLGAEIEHPIEAVVLLANMVRGGALLKGGHWPDGGRAVDWWCGIDSIPVALAAYPRIEDDVRGTGCQLSSAIAANLANGHQNIMAIHDARGYLHKLLHHARYTIGLGRPVIVRASKKL